MSDHEVVPIGSLVEYRGTQRHGTYKVTGHADPIHMPGVSVERFKAAYPDGVAYEIWPVGVEKRFDNRELGVFNVRRTSFEVSVWEGERR